jgi:hypothetical protein
MGCQTGVVGGIGLRPNSVLLQGLVGRMNL